ncbi:MAG: hypothetical protein GEU28_12335, partial [Dehalococcoidia bacterium]|nr:hypothetical protein [Dehalococcoidia bacterium]
MDDGAFGRNGHEDDERARPRLSRRAIFMAVVTLLFSLVAIVVTFGFLTPSTSEVVGRGSQFAAGSVTWRTSENYYIVRLESGEFRA